MALDVGYVSAVGAGAISFLSDSEIEINQERTPRRRVVAILIHHKIIDRNVSMEEAGVEQGFVSFNTTP